MCKKPCASMLQMSCLLLMLLVFSSSTHGEDSSTNKVVDFNVHISESGEDYDEKIEVNSERQTESFQVPAHPGVDRTDVLHDFKQNITMLRFPERKACYLLPLDKEMSNPEKLIRDLETNEQRNITEGRRTDSAWIAKEELNGRSFLSDDLQQLCAGYPIYLVKKTQDSLPATRIEKGEATERVRKRRWSRCYRKCTVVGRTCYPYVRCSGFFWGRRCRRAHPYVNIVSCKIICYRHPQYGYGGDPAGIPV